MRTFDGKLRKPGIDSGPITPTRSFAVGIGLELLAIFLVLLAALLI